MSDLSNKFLQALIADIEKVSVDTGLAGQRLREMSTRLEIRDGESSVPVSLDKEHGRAVIHSGHPAVKALIDRTTRRRTDLIFVISSLMSLINREEEEVEDDHERVLHARLLKFALEECQGSWNSAV